jgi:hypothetical protein
MGMGGKNLQKSLGGRKTMRWQEAVKLSLGWIRGAVFDVFTAQCFPVLTIG